MSRRPPPRGGYPRRAPAAGAQVGRRPAASPAYLPMFILGAFGVLAVALFIGLLMLYGTYTSGLRNATDIEDFTLVEGSRVLSADGQELASFAAERRQVVSFDEIPELLRNAQVAAEDRTFWSNPCIDFKGILRAAYQNFIADNIVSGASTICQQLVRNRLLDPELMTDPDRILERKIKEAILALRVGNAYPGEEGKRQLLEMYMNQVYYGNQAYGIAAAVEAYFGKDITSDDERDQVTLAEAALVVSLVRAPSRLDPTAEAVIERIDGRRMLVVPETAGAKETQRIVLASMVRSEYITQAEADAAFAEPIILARQRASRYRAPHFVYAVRSEAAELLGSEEALDTAGLEIVTTLDYEGYQAFAEKWAGVAYDLDRLSDQRLIDKYGQDAFEWIQRLQGRNINNDALVTLNYRTGAVLAYVGSANYYGEVTDEHQPAFDVVGQAFRQSGSAFKPITYATGFETGTITPATMFMDVEGEIVDGYSVPNADNRERGPVRVRDALKYSLNIPVAKAQQLIGTDQVVAMAERLGLEWDPQHNGEVAVPSLTLGTIGVHQLDLAAAYGAMANGGILAEPYMIQTITDRNGEVIYDHATDAQEPQRVMSAQSAYLVTDILADNTDPQANSIWGPSFQITTDDGRRPATLKTGTTNDFVDLQAFGYFAPDADAAVHDGAIVTGVWVGNSNNEPIADVFAADGPTFIWHDYMAEVAAHNELPIRDFPRPGGIVELEVDRMSGMLPGEETISTITEVFDETHRPTAQDDIHRSLRIEAETGKIWQEGCGDFETTGGDDDDPEPRERVYLDLGDYEDHHPAWDRANDRWIERWQGREGQIDRFPLERLDAPLAPTETCTPGEVPTSTPTPSPSPTPTATPIPSETPVPTPTPLVPTPPLPTPTPTPEP